MTSDASLGSTESPELHRCRESSKAEYARRIDRVTNYLLMHLDESPSLEKLARVACFSPFHFHRIFTAITGETVNSFCNRLRLEKAARLLKYSDQSATDIALSCGFSCSATFSRSFKQYFGISPSGFKRSGGDIKNSKICKELFPVRQYLIAMSEEQLRMNFPVAIRRLPERRVAFIRVVGAYYQERVLRAFERLVRWAKAMKLYDTETFFGMSLDDPMVTPKDKYRYEACVTIPVSAAVQPDADISIMNMPSRTYAVTRVSGDFKMAATATHYLLEKWLINSGYEPEHAHGLEIFLDKENICNWSHFDLDLCIPVKPLQRFY